MKNSRVIKNTLHTTTIQIFYDRLGKRYDWFELFEGGAKARAHQLLELIPGQRLLNVGAGTGKEHARLQACLDPGGSAHAVDISRIMAILVRERTTAPACQADARNLPYGNTSFDRLYSAYVLDLLPSADIPGTLSGFCRVLKPGGKMVLVGLTEGIDFPSRALVSAWKLVYAASPVVCGGCRPLQLTELVIAAGFKLLERDVIVQLSVPSEILLAARNS